MLYNSVAVKKKQSVLFDICNDSIQCMDNLSLTTKCCFIALGKQYMLFHLEISWQQRVFKMKDVQPVHLTLYSYCFFSHCWF